MSITITRLLSNKYTDKVSLVIDKDTKTVNYYLDDKHYFVSGDDIKQNLNKVLILMEQDTQKVKNAKI